MAWPLAIRKSVCRYTELIRLCFQHEWIASLGAVSTVLCTPLRKWKRTSKFYIFTDVSHTHPLPGQGSFLDGSGDMKSVIA